MTCPFLPFCHLPLSLCLSLCPWLWQLFFLCVCVCVGEVMCVRMCARAYTGPWLKNKARAVYIGANEHQYLSSWWELRRCKVARVQPCAEKEGGCRAEERGLRGKEMQRLAEGGGRSELQVRNLRQVEAMPFFFNLLVRWGPIFKVFRVWMNQNGISLVCTFRIWKKIIFPEYEGEQGL